MNNFSMEGRMLIRDGKELDSVNMEQGIEVSSEIEIVHQNEDMRSLTTILVKL